MMMKNSSDPQIHSSILPSDVCSTSYDEEVESVLVELDLKQDSLDEPDFNVVDYINELFPTEQSIESIDNVIGEFEGQISQLDADIRTIIRDNWHQPEVEEQGQLVIKDSVQVIQTLFSRISDIQERASRSEQMVHEITADIQRLDRAKRNLTLSISTLNNLILIVTAVDKLNLRLNITAGDAIQPTPVEPVKPPPPKSSMGKNPFEEDNSHPTPNDSSSNRNSTAQLTLLTSPQSIIELSESLSQAQRLMAPMTNAYGDLGPVKRLGVDLAKIESTLGRLLLDELKSLLSTVRSTIDNTHLIQAACRLLVDSMPDRLNVKGQLIAWFLSRQLGEYRELFDATQTCAWLDKIDQRYAWLRSNLTPVERRFNLVFPMEWCITERFIVEFCRQTRSQLADLMRLRRVDLTHQLFTSSLQRTLQFETSLASSYPGDCDLPTSFDTLGRPLDGRLPDSERSTPTSHHRFDGIISSCFEPYYDIYLGQIEKALHDQLFDRLIGDFTVNRSSAASKSSSVAAASSSDEPDTSGPSAENTLASATDFFLLYKQALKQTLALTRAKPMVLGLVKLLRAYLIHYLLRALLCQLPGLSLSPDIAGSTGGPGDSSTTSTPASSSNKLGPFNLSKLDVLGLTRGQSSSGSSNSSSVNKPPNPFSLSDFSSSLSTNQLIASGIRESQQLPKLNKDGVFKVCIVLSTTAFCLKTVEELERRIKKEVRPQSWADADISFSLELDAYAAGRSVSVHRLVSDLELSIESCFGTMQRLGWSQLTKVGDHSQYVSDIVAHLRLVVPVMRDTLICLRSTFTQICIKYADWITTRFVASLYQCRPINAFGAEQLLLDTQSLKSALLQMPGYGSRTTAPHPRAYTNVVQEGMGKAERLIKAVMLPIGRQQRCASPTVGDADTSSHQPQLDLSPDSIDLFLAGYCQLIPPPSSSKSTSDSSAEASFCCVELEKVLGMKGIKPADQGSILDAFRTQLKVLSTQSLTE